MFLLSCVNFVGIPTRSDGNEGEAVDLIIQYYGKIPKKLGMRANHKFEIYSELLLRICHHPNTNTAIVLKLDKELERLNPEYKLEISDSLEKGLNTRGI